MALWQFVDPFVASVPRTHLDMFRSSLLAPLSLSFALLVSVAAVGTAGCDSGPSEAEKKAMEEAAAKKKAEEDAIAARRAEREAKEKAAEEAEQARLAALGEIATIPEDMEEPKNAEAACQAVADAQDAMMQKYLPEDKKSGWEAGKSGQLQMAKTTCIKTGSVKVAMCQAHAMNSVPKEHYKDFNDLIRICAEKYKEGAAEGDDAEAAG